MNIPAEFRRENHYHSEPSRKRHRRARHWVLIIGLLLLVANGLTLRYAFDPLSAAPLIGGLACGSVLASLVLLVAIWQRQMWARYILLCVVWVTLVTFSVPLLRDLGPGGSGLGRSSQTLLAGLIFYVLANVILIRSRSIRLLVSPASSRG